jgi:hypothetical protein
MLQQIENLPPGIIGVEAHGKIEKEDYEKVIIPMLETAYKSGRKIKFLYHFTPDFTGFSAGAAWDDFKIGMRYLRLFEGCAIVSNTEWINKSTKIAGFFMTCPVKVFENSQLPKAINWLATELNTPHLEVKMIPDKGVMLLDIKHALTPANFEYVASIADPWIEQHGKLNGLVLHATEFPGWKSLGGLIQHFKFIKEHHKKVKRIAVASDGAVMTLLPQLGTHFVEAEIKSFNFADLDSAVLWASTPL